MTARRLIAGLDIETTGLSQVDGHRMIEIALIIYDLDSESEVARHVTRLDPQRAIDAKAEAVHKISSDMVRGQRLWESVASGYSALLARCKYVVAHNGIGFDAPFMWGEFKRVGVPAPNVIIVDTMLQGRWATPDGAVPNLGALCFASGVSYDTEKAHSAAYDVCVMMECFFKNYRAGFFNLPASYFEYVPEKKEKK